MILSDGHVNKRISDNDRIEEPGQVGKAVAEGGSDDQDPESIAKAIYSADCVVPIILQVFLDADIPGHNDRRRAIKQKVPPETDP